jgi:polyferredoxin
MTLCLVSIGLAIFKGPGNWLKGLPKKVKRAELSLLALSAVIIIVSIVMVEYLAQVNRVGSVNDIQSVGQFIALLTGALLLGGIIRGVVAGERSPRKWLLFGR